MRVIDPGHRYELEILDLHFHADWPRELIFVKREGPKFPGNVGHHPGTTCQEVLRAVVDRLHYVGHQIPAWQTTVAMFLGGVMIWLLEHRAARRHGRRSPGLKAAIRGEGCERCGHVGCQGGCHAG